MLLLMWVMLLMCRPLIPFRKRRKEAVKSLQNTVDKQQHKTCKLELRLAEKKCQIVFSFSEWILNRASK